MRYIAHATIFTSTTAHGVRGGGQVSIWLPSDLKSDALPTKQRRHHLPLFSRSQSTAFDRDDKMRKIHSKTRFRHSEVWGQNAEVWVVAQKNRYLFFECFRILKVDAAWVRDIVHANLFFRNMAQGAGRQRAGIDLGTLRSEAARPNPLHHDSITQFEPRTDFLPKFLFL